MSGGFVKTSKAGPLGPTGPTGPSGEGTGGGSLSPINGTAGESLSQYQVVYCDPSDGKYYKATNNGTSAQSSVVGIVTQSGGISSSSSGEITLLNTVTNGSWSWTPGSPLFLDSTAGSMTQTEPANYGTYWVPLGYAISATQVWFQVGTGTLLSNSSSNTVVMTGTQASRPSASTLGRIFLPTNGYYPSVDSGSAWIPQPQMGSSFQVSSPPQANTWTAVNQSSSTLVNDGDGLLVTYMGRSDGTQRGEAYLKALPSPPYSLVIGVELLMIFPTQYTYFAPVLADGTSTGSKHTEFQIVHYNSMGPILNLAKFSSISADAGSPYYTATNCGPPITSGKFFIRLRDDNTYRYYELSADGRNWSLFGKVSRTDFLTPTHGGFLTGHAVTAPSSEQVVVQAKIFHWYLGT